MFITLEVLPVRSHDWPACETCDMSPPPVECEDGWRFEFRTARDGTRECKACSRYRLRTRKPRPVALRDQAIERDYRRWMDQVPTANHAAGILQRP